MKLLLSRLRTISVSSSRPVLALAGRPLSCFALALASGIGLGLMLTPRLSMALILLAAASVVSLLLCLTMKRKTWLFLLPAWVGLGLFLCAGQMAALSAWPTPMGEYAQVSGWVRGAAMESGTGYRVQLRVDRVNGASLDCADIYVLADGPLPRAGSYIQTEGRVLGREYANPGAFSYGEYLGRHGIAAQVSARYYGTVQVIERGPVWSMANLGSWLRHRFDLAASCLSERQRSLVYGVFLGEKSGLDQSMLDAMSLSGLMHLFAVSGLHIGYIVTLALAIAGQGYGSGRSRFLVTIVLLALYLALTGWAASILRASLMSLLFLQAGLLKEQADGLTSLSLAALVCLIARPLWLADAGFLLSFAAVWGVMVLTPLFSQGLNWRVLPGGRAAAASVAATLATLPLTAWFFGYIPWTGWLLAPIAIPLAGVAVSLSFAALPVAVLWPWLAGWLLQAAGFIMEFLSFLADSVAAAPGLSTRLAQISLATVIIYYCGLLSLPLLCRYRPGRGLLVMVPLCLLLIVSPLLTPHKGAMEGELMRVAFLDVGQGDAALITTADGCSLLVDGGGRAASPGSVGQYVVLPYLRDQGLTRLDAIVSSHPDADHSDGLLTILNHMPVSDLIITANFPEDQMQRQLLSAAKDQGCQLIYSGQGAVYSLGQYALLTVLSPAAPFPDDNDNSLVLRVSCGEVDFLFTGDASGTVLAHLGDELAAEIVKLPHHGSASGYDEDFYTATQAEAVVLSVGADNNYGHPDEKVLEYWQDQALCLRTDERGAITFTTDGHTWRVVTEEN